MNAPYEGKFKISQAFTRGKHDGLDLVGIDSKKVRATVNGTVEYAGWQNPDDKYQGFGLYVCIRFPYGSSTAYAYFGHLSSINVKTGDKVNITDIIGTEGSTGNSTGSHVHYEIRKGFYKGAEVVNINDFSGIPNEVNSILDDGWRENKTTVNSLYGKTAFENCKLTIDVDKHKIEIMW